MFEHPRNINYIADNDDQILGYICVLPLSKEEADIESIAVDPAAHRSGIGTILFNRAESELLRRGFRKIILEVRENNAQAINFYKKHGFKVMQFLSGYYSIPIGGTKNAYRMHKFLDL